MTRRAAAILAVLFLVLAPAGCGSKSADSSLPVTRMKIGPETFNLEIAASDHDQEVGLMHRDGMDSDHGMIFPLADEKVQTFWNHDVRFNLDLIFLDAGGAVVSLKHLEAYNEKGVSSDVIAKYAIELNAGTVDRIHLKLGDRLEVPKDAVNPAGK
ncbi:MAG: DUF192 domain-containing protein [Tepidisphaeraceae bacterium]|jgi:uncharacterized membrane protein (UPF0127 family)